MPWGGGFSEYSPIGSNCHIPRSSLATPFTFRMFVLSFPDVSHIVWYAYHIGNTALWPKMFSITSSWYAETDCRAWMHCDFSGAPLEYILRFLEALLLQDAHDLVVYLTPETRNLLFCTKYRWLYTALYPIYPACSWSDTLASASRLSDIYNVMHILWTSVNSSVGLSPFTCGKWALFRI